MVFDVNVSNPNGLQVEAKSFGALSLEIYQYHITPFQDYPA